MKKLVPVLALAMVLVFAFTVAASAANGVWTPQDGLYDITYDLGKDKTGTMYGMVVIEAPASPATFELTEANIRYIDQVTAAGNELSFDSFAPMDLKNNGTYYVYIGGGDYTAAQLIGTLSTTDNPQQPPVVTPVVPTAVALSQTTATLEIDGTVTLTETVTPADAKYTAQWTTSDSAVAEVVNGVVTAKSAGTATITVTVATGITATCEVTVNAPQTPDDEVAGDVNSDGVATKADVTYLINHLTFYQLTGKYPVTYTQSLDFNSDGATNKADGTYLINHLTFYQLTGKYPLYPSTNN